jgi:hypothetical protein
LEPLLDASLLKRVRSACKTVAEEATQVRINHDAIPSYAATLPLDRAALPELDASRHYLGHGEDTLAFLLTLDAINFGSGYFPHLRKRLGMSGYFTVAAFLKDYYQKHGPLSAQELLQLTSRNCAEIFNQGLDEGPIRELMQLFTTALNDLGRYLLDSFNGNFATLVETAGHSVERLVQLLITMPYFQDVGRYKGFEVPFYKRAQLTAADLSLAFSGDGLGRFDDLNQLTIFADNLVPHVLRVDGMLLYEEELAARIDAGELIPANSAEEIEIRACAVHAVELMVNALHESGRNISAMRLDYLLWNRGQQPHYKKVCPRHRTRTVFY